MNDNKKEILEELLLTEEDTLKTLKDLIDKTKAMIKIDEKSNKVVLSSEYSYSNSEKILLCLIGRYFCKELGLCEKEGLDLREIETETGIKKTTLSKPIGGLVHSGYLGQDKDKKYFIHHHKIEDVIKILHDKYVNKNPNAKSLYLKYKLPDKKRGGSINGPGYKDDPRRS